MNDRELTLKLDQARWWALREQPFYGSLAMGLTDEFADVPTACTNGKVVKWNRDFLAKLSEEETRFVVLHETLHCAHGHLWRLPHDKAGNDAGDYVINRTLANVNGIRMPEGGLECPYDWNDFAEEEIYSRLCEPGQKPGDEKPDEQPGNACGDFEAPAAGDQPGEGEGDDADEDGSQAGEPLKDEWERRVIQAQQVANAMGQGDLPGDLQRVLERVKHQPIDWRQEMSDFVRSVVSTRNDWSRPARRHACQDVIYPRKRADDLGLVIFARDTSGSIEPELCAAFSAHITSALADVGCRGLVLDCDSEIQAEYALEPGEECPLTAKGGGGTSHQPIFEKAAELVDGGERIAGIVCLTDLLTTFPDGDGGLQSLWLSTSSRRTAPFGRTVRI
jgi:predicted metal-dependent peptidase